MTSALQWSLTGAAGVCGLVAVRALFMGFRTPPSARHLAVAIAAIAVGAYQYSALGVYRSGTIDAFLLATKVHVALALGAYVTLLWCAALGTGRTVPWLLGSATVLSVGVAVWNLLLPESLLFGAVLDLQGVLLPWGEMVVQVVAIPSRWSHAVELMTFALYSAFACLWLVRPVGSEPDTHRSISVGLAVVLATMVVEVADPRVVPMLPADEVGLTALVLALGLTTR